MFCKFCGKELLENAIFCAKCGKKISNKTKNEIVSDNTIIKDQSKENSFKFCKYCGVQVASAAKYCPKCGKNITQIHETSAKNFDEPKNNVESETITNKQFITTEDVKNNSHEKFCIGNLFSKVFEKHTAQERNEILKAGLANDVLQDIKLKPENLKPWFYSRVFLILFAVFVIFEICLLNFHNKNIMPGIMLIGSVMVPFALLTMYFELNIYKDISFYKSIGIFLLGGAVSLLFTLVLYEIIPTTGEFNFIEASLISIIEELGKVVIIILLLKRDKNITVLKGLLIGGAIGCGFAAFESAGYAFNIYLDAHDYNTRADIANNILRYSKYGYINSIGEMNSTIILRSILTFGGHSAWAAIEGAAYAKQKKIDKGFIKFFAICFILHALWDTFPTQYFILACLCLIAWRIIIKQISKFIDENKQKQTEGK